MDQENVGSVERHAKPIDQSLLGRKMGFARALPILLACFIRPEQRFSGLDALKAQIAADVARAQAILAAA
jgi:FAD synthase